MPMPTTSIAEFQRHLDEFTFAADAIVVVHSSLISFGRLEGGVAGVYSMLRNRLGEGATVVIPTFTTGLAAEEPYDPMRTRSQGMGALSEYVRQLPGAARSLCPMHSYAAVGPRAGIVRDADFTLSFGPKSIFETLCKEGAALFLLGCAFTDGATHVHQIEAEVGVPYREWLWLERRVLGPDGHGHRLALRYYGRKKVEGVRRPWSSARIFERLVAEGLVRTVPAPLGASHLVALPDVQRIGAEMIRAFPELLLS
jgi:hypothetical protein